MDVLEQYSSPGVFSHWNICGVEGFFFPSALVNGFQFILFCQGHLSVPHGLKLLVGSAAGFALRLLHCFPAAQLRALSVKVACTLPSQKPN